MKEKILLSILVICVFVIVSVYAFVSNKESTLLDSNADIIVPQGVSQWKTSRNDHYRYSVKYPSSWSDIGFIEQNKDSFNDSKKLIYHEISTKTGVYFGSDASFTVAVHSVDENTDLTELIKQDEDVVSLDFLGGEVSSPNIITVSGQEGIEYTIDFKGYEGAGIQREILIRQDDWVYDIEMQALEGKYDDYKDTFEQMLENFVFLKDSGL